MSISEERKFTRVNFQTTITVSTDEAEISSQRMRDVSLGGIFIVTKDDVYKFAKKISDFAKS